MKHRLTRNVLLLVVLVGTLLIGPAGLPVGHAGRIPTYCPYMNYTVPLGTGFGYGQTFTTVYGATFNTGDLLTMSDIQTNGLDHLDVFIEYPDGHIEQIASIDENGSWQFLFPEDGYYFIMRTYYGTNYPQYIGYTYSCVNILAEPLADGRINPYDYAASATGFCVDDGIDLYAISAEGAGSPAFHVSDAAIGGGLAQARESGQHMLLDAQIGVRLWALADRDAMGHDQLQLMGPEGYTFIFPAERCD